MGGPMGFVYSTVPVVVFVAANAFLPLPTTIVVSIAVGLGLTGFRLLRRERFVSAVGGLLGVAAIKLLAVLGRAAFGWPSAACSKGFWQLQEAPE